MTESDAPDESLITDAVRAAIARARPPRRVTIEPLALRRLMEALGERRPLRIESGEPAPLYALNLLQPDNEPLDLPSGLDGSLVVGDEWESIRPLRIGEPLTVESRVTDAYERFGGRFGQMLYLRYEWTYTAADGSTVALARRIMGHYRSVPREAVDGG